VWCGVVWVVCIIAEMVTHAVDFLQDSGDVVQLQTRFAVVMECIAAQMDTSVPVAAVATNKVK